MASATDNTAGVAVPAKKYAYVTMITSDSFMPGLQCMVYSLQKTGTKIPICVLVTCQVSKITQLQIKSLGVKLVVVKPIGNPNTNSHVPGWVNSGYTKLHIWNLTEFDKVVYVDADTIVLQGIDELFKRPTPAAAPDTFPPDKFNAGVMVICPSKARFDDMQTKIAVLPSYDTGDTGFLNSYFKDWYTMPAGHRLPFGYNALRTMFWLTAPRTRGYWDAVKPLKIIHYCSSPKPWDDPKKKGELEMLWWTMFVESKLGGLKLPKGMVLPGF